MLFCLQVPAVMEVGYCLAGGRKTCVMECVNSGGEGTFILTQPSATDPTDETVRTILCTCTTSGVLMLLTTV